VLLAIDTSTRNVGIALYDGIRVISEIIWSSQDYHTVELAPAINEILNRAGIKIKDIECCAVASGPGSFTGLRIGMAVAKGLALANHMPIIGIPTLDIVAESQPTSLGLPLVTALQAGRGRLAVGWYLADNGQWQLNPPILSHQRIQSGDLPFSPSWPGSAGKLETWTMRRPFLQRI
jgi:tRNA threonylcarbamoyladenosine biosynthesis protein TsaB